jgi:DNA-binding transcriptional ArsR family regulator
MDALDRTFAALADPTRRAILARLAQGESHVGALVEPFPISGPAISRHLRVLEQAGLIEREAAAQWRICRLRPAGLRPAHDWLDDYRAFWEESLDRLAELLEEKPHETPRTPRKRRSRTTGRKPAQARHRKARP